MNNKTKSDRVQQLKHTDEQLWKQIKAAAVTEGKTMTEVVEEILSQQLAARNTAEK